MARVIVGYAALWLADLVFKIDFRFWIVALKLMGARQFLIFLIYLRSVHGLLRDRAACAAPEFLDRGGRARRALPHQYFRAYVGFILLLVLQYGTLWLTGKLFNPLPDPGFVPLSTIVAIQFVPLLAIAAVIATFTWRRTGSSLPGALICGMFVTWYVVAGTATQAAFSSQKMG